MLSRTMAVQRPVRHVIETQLRMKITFLTLFQYALAALVVVCFFNAVASDKILKIGGAIGAATIGYGIHVCETSFVFL